MTAKPASVYAKLSAARVRLQGIKMSKSGENKFAGYSYFELGDFMPHINTIFSELGLCGVVSFGEAATLTVVNCDQPDETVVFASPMSEASLKGCHQIQNLGAVQTYLRRYLYMTCLEIVEHDALDGAPGADKQQAPPKQKAQHPLNDAKPATSNAVASIKAELELRLPGDLAAQTELLRAQTEFKGKAGNVCWVAYDKLEIYNNAWLGKALGNLRKLPKPEVADGYDPFN